MKCIVVSISHMQPIEGAKLQRVELCGFPDGAEKVVVTGNHYVVGTLGFFIPEGAIVPEKLLREMWLWNDELGKGRLAGKQGNRVKVRLYGTVRSEGLYYGSQYFEGGDPGGPFKTSDSWNSNWRLGHDVAPELGITFREGE